MRDSRNEMLTDPPTMQLLPSPPLAKRLLPPRAASETANRDWMRTRMTSRIQSARTSQLNVLSRRMPQVPRGSSLRARSGKRRSLSSRSPAMSQIRTSEPVSTCDILSLAFVVPILHCNFLIVPSSSNTPSLERQGEVDSAARSLGFRPDRPARGLYSSQACDRGTQVYAKSNTAYLKATHKRSCRCCPRSDPPTATPSYAAVRSHRPYAAFRSSDSLETVQQRV